MSGLDQNTQLNRILKFFQQYEYSGGGEIQNFEKIGNSKVKITYWHKRGRKNILILYHANVVLSLNKFKTPKGY